MLSELHGAEAAPEESSLAVVDHDAGLPAGRVSTLPVTVMNAGLTEFVDRRKAFRSWLLMQLEKGVHYGVPPGCEFKTDANGNLLIWNWKKKCEVVVSKDQWRGKPVLYQAGAQMLCEMLRLRPQWAADEAAWRMLGAVPGSYVSRCRLLFMGGPFFDGYAIGDVVGESIGGVEAEEKGHPANTRLKVAEKRAMVGAVVNALSLSDLFTQDLDNMAAPGEAPDADPNAHKVLTRAARKDAAAKPAKPVDPAVKDAVKAAFEDYRSSIGSDSWADFAAYARKTLNAAATMAAAEHWTLDDAKAVHQAISAEADQ